MERKRGHERDWMVGWLGESGSLTRLRRGFGMTMSFCAFSEAEAVPSQELFMKRLVETWRGGSA